MTKEEIINKITELQNNGDSNDEETISNFQSYLKFLDDVESNEEYLKQQESEQSDEPEIDLGEDLKSGMSKVWIDENLGVYMMYDKANVIAATMKSFFGVVDSIPKETLESIGYENEDELYLEISQIDQPGLPSLLGIFIDLVVKAVGSFAKHFFVLKNTIDLLAGFQIGELLSNAIPMIGKVIADITKFLTDTKTWLFEQVLGPMFDVNIPIPEFEFDLGSLIPLLPIKLTIPEIDNLGIFSKDTALNIDIDQTNIPLTWREDIVDEYRIEQKKIKEGQKTKTIALTEEIEKDILKLLDELNGVVISTIDNQLKAIELELKKINQEFNYNKIKFEQNDISITEEILDDNCSLIKKINDRKESLLAKKSKKIEELKNFDKDAIRKDLEDKLLELQRIKTIPILTEKDFRKRATLLKYKLNSEDLTTKISEIYYMGIDIFNDDVISYLQRLGHNFNDDKYLTKIKELQKLGIDFNNTKLLKRLFDIGYNLNDKDYKSKISRFLDFVDINNTEIIQYLIKMGFNINANFEHIVQMTDLKISFKEIIIMENLYSIGFNFNNTEIINRLVKLSKFIDISDPVAYENILKKNINLNNPYFEDIIKNSMRIGLGWSDENFEDVEQEILNLNVNDIDYLLYVLDKFKATNNQLYLYKLYSSSGDTSFSNIYNFIDSVQPSTNTTFKILSEIATTFRTEPLEQYYTDDYGIRHNIDGTYYVPEDSTYLYDFGLYKIDINRFSKYGIKIDFPDDFDLNSYKNIKYSYPDGVQTFRVPILNGQMEYEYKLLLMRDFIINQAWIIDGVNISKQPDQIDYQKIITASNQYGLYLTTNINAVEGQISTDALQGIYGNFDKLGLNLKDDYFDIKVQQFTNLLNIKLDETVIINTERQVLLTYRDYKKSGNPTITIDLNKKNADPEIYEDEKYNAKIEIFNIRDESAVEQPTKPLIQFSALNKLGLNFQNPKYYSLLTKIKGLSFDISKFKVSDIVDNLISLGWHFNIDSNFYKLGKLISIGFSFLVNPISGESLSANDMASKLNSLNNIGFNFNKDLTMLDSLKQLGFNMRNKDFEIAIQEIMSFGINFNDVDWKVKIDKLSSLQINFSADDWQNKMSNLRMLGITFVADDWLQNYNKVFEYKTFGIDYNNKENTKKIESLNSIGLKFDDEDYKEKIEGLIKIGIATIPQSIINQKYNIENKWKDDLNNIDKEIIRLQTIRNSTDEVLPNIDRLLELSFQKRIDDAPQTFDLNTDITLNSLDKIKSLDKLNFNFYEPDWKGDIKKLVDKGLNFSKNDWATKVEELKDLLPVNSILEWKKTITEMLKMVVTAPIGMLSKMIEKVIDLINQILGIPLNPTKIPEWAKGIIVKFKNLIELLIKLPTLEGMMDFLFMSPDGLQLVDIVLPGFSETIDKIKTKLDEFNDLISGKVEKVNEFKKEIVSKVQPKIDKVKELKKQIEDKVEPIVSKINSLKKDLTASIVAGLEELQISIQIKIDILLEEKENIQSKVQVEIDELMKSKIEIEEKLQKQISKVLEEIEIIKEKITPILNVLDWSNNIDKIKDLFVEQIKDTPNPFKEQIDALRTQLNDLKDSEKIKETQKKIADLKVKFDEFNAELQEQIQNITNMLDKIPPALNVVTSTPKFMVNIFIGIFNAVGTMENLPNLWEFEYV